MDAALVEKITRLVISELEKYHSEPLPLTEAEIRRWNEITSAMKGSNTRSDCGNEQVTFHRYD